MDTPYKDVGQFVDLGILKGTSGRLRKSKEGVNAVRETFGNSH
jgi:hypothetical protein